MHRIKGQIQIGLLLAVVSAVAGSVIWMSGLVDEVDKSSIQRDNSIIQSVSDLKAEIGTANGKLDVLLQVQGLRYKSASSTSLK